MGKIRQRREARGVRPIPAPAPDVPEKVREDWDPALDEGEVDELCAKVGEENVKGEVEEEVENGFAVENPGGRGARFVYRRMIRTSAGRPPLSHHPDVLRAACECVRRHADKSTGELSRPLRTLTGNLRIREILGRAPSSTEAAELISALIETEIIKEYHEDEGIAIVNQEGDGT